MKEITGEKKPKANKEAEQEKCVRNWNKSEKALLAIGAEGKIIQ